MADPITVRPNHVAVTVDNPYNPSIVVGGDAALSDDLDATYAQISHTLLIDNITEIGDLIVASFPSVLDTGAQLINANLAMRMEYFIEGNATLQQFQVEGWRRHDGPDPESLGFWTTGSAPFPLSQVPDPDMIYDLGSWFLFSPLGDDVYAELVDTLANAEFAIRMGAAGETGHNDSVWTLRVYELALILTYAETLRRDPAPRRLTPRADGRGIGSGRRFPPDRAI